MHYSSPVSSFLQCLDGESYDWFLFFCKITDSLLFLSIFSAKWKEDNFWLQAEVGSKHLRCFSLPVLSQIGRRQSWRPNWWYECILFSYILWSFPKDQDYANFPQTIGKGQPANLEEIRTFISIFCVKCHCIPFHAKINGFFSRLAVKIEISRKKHNVITLFRFR